ncbi:NOP protein chaperone 1-like [Heptranchias perlo]|uniref:NOP protein chaperone 1-like n=1 Tax=Heptranchias perlo TaxID=212740 RepID=UPI00355A742C
MAASGSGAAPAGRREARRSAELLRAGSGPGFNQKLLINAGSPSTSAPPRMVRVPRSGVLDKLQSFLPQMAKANEELRKQMETTDARQFDIENIENCPKIIEMNVSLFEMSGSDEGGADEVMSECESVHSDSEQFGEVTEVNLKLPRTQGQRRSKIEVVSGDDTE